MRANTLNAFIGAAALAVLGLTPPQAATAQTSPGSTVRVSVANVRAQQGFIMAALYDEANWGQTAVARARVPVTNGAVAFNLAAPAPGRYAIRMFHDVDSDGAMDTNVIGVPIEPIGFSNDAPLQFGPPSFAAAAFNVEAAGASQAITLR